MATLILALALCGQARCVGPNCPTTAGYAISPDTEVVQNIWIPNEGRWGVGVIRGGRFVAAVQPAAQPVVDDTGDVGDVLNYGILRDARIDATQGYTSNDPGFRPPVHDPPNEPPVANGLVNTALAGGSFVLILFGLTLIAAKGRRQ
jgi:hypothetical protein